MFIDILKKVDAAMFSRLDPSQKGELALIAKNKLKLNTCAMGDGFNDDIML